MITEFLLKKKLEEQLSHVKEENTIYVTDLVKCPRKVKYESEYKELAISQVYAPSAILGDILHLGLENLLKENFTAEAEVETQREIQVEGRVYKIKGKADAIIKNSSGESIIIEIKTSRSDKGLPLIHHKMQLQIYLWLFNTKKGILIYITPDRIAEYEINEPLDEATIVRLAEDTITLRNSPRFNWECKYCIFSVICPAKLT
ncbi:CRISPR-associated protein Cas4 [Sulfolobus islandicus Y.G.57.14]|jgi:CRISPR-associated protein Cas4|uniref:CRISPR-associated exonuclease Cas4 n=4 Tax=Saccharolobus islandicus TaxID=43080 RepID=C3MJW0_SACI2|nr:CRISPR-associated protein Cas4 [Sulfolobus islandicus]ACP36263.1 CRISPR-associated protein Cas4 [Sulfolobus islandicus L.S.2.15]ACP46491.1 CRISPR-associated protein Cas4 [Sulfolobus islandicus Y.G.57.14]ACP47803.1 CRISPR-associated protein Cas4 [Sulfolobus islandicus Y.N.15.51]ADB88024.1 CRISPR-associated protein Cas4 [Sulfolobus islandicus L.D.8.5]PVU77996.1 CRISPR-associated protein Cas4 [Sulfolobus islandicus]